LEWGKGLTSIHLGPNRIVYRIQGSSIIGMRRDSEWKGLWAGKIGKKKFIKLFLEGRGSVMVFSSVAWGRLHLRLAQSITAK